jgi:hypothetical protein
MECGHGIFSLPYIYHGDYVCLSIKHYCYNPSVTDVDTVRERWSEHLCLLMAHIFFRSVQRSSRLLYKRKTIYRSS